MFTKIFIKVELKFEVKDDEKFNVNGTGIVLQDVKIIGGKWDQSTKSIIISE